MTRTKAFALRFLKAMCVLVCLFSYFMAFGITFFVPGGDESERFEHTVILFGICALVTAATGLLFWKTSSEGSRNAFWRTWRERP